MPDLKIECPFCKQKTIMVFYRPAYKGAGKARGSGVTSHYSFGVDESYEVLSGCSACGKTVKEVKKKLGY